MPLEADTTRAEIEHYAKLMRGLWHLLDEVRGLPLERVAFSQRAAITHLQLANPAQWAKVGRQLEWDALLVDELLTLRRTIEQRIPELRRTAEQCASLSPRSSDPISSPPKGGVM
jgi:hypothetical protein